jgi:polyisoprenoid-binding protein YceI
MALMRWNVDKAHSDLTFRVRHMVIARVRGTFGQWEADLEIDPDDLESSHIEVRVDTASIDTREDSRDAHLRSPDFFHVEEHPQMVFRSTRVERHADERLRVWGDLTIRDITKEIPLEVHHSGRLTDPWGKDRIGFEARGEIDRKAFGLVWNAPIETGGMLVGDKVEISVDLEATAAEEQREVA